MKWYGLIIWLSCVSAFAGRLEDEAKVQDLWNKIEVAHKIYLEADRQEEGNDRAKHYNEVQRKSNAVKLARANFNFELAKFVLAYNYVPVESGTFRDEFGAVNFEELYVSLDAHFYCFKGVNEGSVLKADSNHSCPRKLRAAEKRNKRFAEKYIGPLANKQSREKNEIPDDPEPISEPSALLAENLGRGYKRRISGAGVLTIERAYPNSKSPKMILIAYEGIDELKKDTIVPLNFACGDETKSLEFQIGSELPEDAVTKGRRILSLQILRFRKRAKVKPDSLTNKELAAIEDFIKQFQGKEISDSNNVLLTEIYPDPDNVKQQIAASWRMPLDSNASEVDLGVQAVFEVEKGK